MQATMLVLGAKILINLHQPLVFLFGAQYLQHSLPVVAENIMLHAKQFMIAGAFAGLKEIVWSSSRTCS